MNENDREQLKAIISKLKQKLTKDELYFLNDIRQDFFQQIDVIKDRVKQEGDPYVIEPMENLYKMIVEVGEAVNGE